MRRIGAAETSSFYELDVDPHAVALGRTGCQVEREKAPRDRQKGRRRVGRSVAAYNRKI